MDSTKFTSSKQAASPLDVSGTPSPADDNKPSYNKMHIAMGGLVQNLTVEHLIGTLAIMNRQSIKGPTVHALEHCVQSN